jgi:hypothetical protein
MPFNFGTTNSYTPGSASPNFSDFQRLYSDGSDHTNSPLAQFSGRFSNSDDHPMPVDSSHNLHFNTLGLSGVSHWPTSDSKANSQLLSLASHEALFSAQNHAYMQLHQRVTILGQDCDVIRAKYATLE